MVGFSGRLHVTNTATGKLVYTTTLPEENPNIWKRSLLLTDALFSDILYVRLFLELPRAYLDYVDIHMNCEDILLNFVVANKTHLPVVHVHWSNDVISTMDISMDFPMEFQGLHKMRKNYLTERSQCLNDFAEWFHGVPLVSTKDVALFN